MSLLQMDQLLPRGGGDQRADEGAEGLWPVQGRAQGLLRGNAATQSS